MPVRWCRVREPPTHKTSVPSSQQDWDAAKHLIEGYYLRSNMRLKDVIEVMHAVYRFRATPRMYKAQFEKWNWHKYSVGPRSKPRRPREGSPPWSKSSDTTAKGKKGVRRVFLVDLGGQALQTNNRLETRLLEPDFSRHLEAGLLAHRGFLLRWSTEDPRWTAWAASPFTQMGGYNPEMFTRFIVALSQMEDHEIADGGKLLRAAFLELDPLVADGHLAAAWDCCVVVPQMAVNRGRPDLIPKFFRYLKELLAIRAPGQPMAILVCFVADLVEVLTTPEAISFYTNAAWTIWTHTILSLPRTDPWSTLQLDYAYLVMQKTPDIGRARSVIDRYNDLLGRAIKTLCSDDPRLLSIEFEALRAQAHFGETAADVLEYEGKLERVLHKLSDKYGSTHLLSWTSRDREIYQGCWYIATLSAERKAGSHRKAECLEMFLEASSAGVWVQYADRLEKKLRGAGKTKEADAVREKRLEVQLPPKTTELLEDEERDLLEGHS
ncbi:Clr5 domain-containing protein [Podospora conica]|nr:Clr5 domain-containing protein [Schizothecium conicum]